MFVLCLQIFLPDLASSWGSACGELGAAQVCLNQTGQGCQGLLRKWGVTDLREEGLS